LSLKVLLPVSFRNKESKLFLNAYAKIALLIQLGNFTGSLQVASDIAEEQRALLLDE
jgi:hypothetical protein